MDEEDSWDLGMEKDREARKLERDLEMEKDREDHELVKRHSEQQKIFDEALYNFGMQFNADLSKLEVKMDYIEDDIERRVLYRVDGLVDTAVIENLDINVTGDFVHSLCGTIEEDDIYCKLYLSVDDIDINYRNRSICQICERYKKTLKGIEEHTASPFSGEGEKLLSEISSVFSNYGVLFSEYETAIFSSYDIEKKEWSRLEWRDVQYAWAY